MAQVTKAPHYDKLIKLVMIGDAHVGKTSLLFNYVENEFNSEYMPTIGVDFQAKKILINNQVVKIHLWDLAGHEKFQTMTRNYYRGAWGFILVYDVTNRVSFNNIHQWIAEIRNFADKNVKIVLVGNKSDLNNCRQVATQEGIDLGKEYGISFVECSAMDQVSSSQPFTTMYEICSQVFEAPHFFKEIRQRVIEIFTFYSMKNKSLVM